MLNVVKKSTEALNFKNNYNILILNHKILLLNSYFIKEPAYFIDGKNSLKS